MKPMLQKDFAAAVAGGPNLMEALNLHTTVDALVAQNGGSPVDDFIDGWGDAKILHFEYQNSRNETRLLAAVELLMAPGPEPLTILYCRDDNGMAEDCEAFLQEFGLAQKVTGAWSPKTDHLAKPAAP